MAASSVSVLGWVADHLNLVGWPVLITFVWWFKGASDKYFSGIDEVKANTASTETVSQEIKRTLELVQNNHLAHLAQDIKEVGSFYEKHTELLTSIDKNIALLVDRSQRN